MAHGVNLRQKCIYEHQLQLSYYNANNHHLRLYRQTIINFIGHDIFKPLQLGPTKVVRSVPDKKNGPSIPGPGVPGRDGFVPR